MEANQNVPATKSAKTLDVIKTKLGEESVRKNFEEVLGKKAPQFMASITNTVLGSKQLQECTPQTILAAAFVAATYDLPIDSNLGFSAIVPYNNKKYNPETKQYVDCKEAQFQMMYKGFIQLAIRSGYYEKMNYATVYMDELKSYNPITGEVEFVKDFSQCTDRNSGDQTKVAGYYAWFQLKTGFRHELYMTKQEVDNHAQKYSASYRYDIKENKKKSLWSTDFDGMALKTVIKRLLSKWGILSVDMQRAIQDDQKTFDEDGKETYGDNTPDIEEAEDPFANAQVVEAEVVQDPAPNPEPQPTSQPAPQAEPQPVPEGEQLSFGGLSLSEAEGLSWN